MLPLARASRVCIFCLHFPVRFYASSPAATGRKAGRKSAAAKATKEVFKSDTVDKPILEEGQAQDKSYKSRIEAFLEDLDASSKRPTLQDLFNMKPSYLVNFDDSGYETEYQAAIKRVTNAFKSDQILEFLNGLKYEGKLPSTRRERTEILLEKSWGWAPPHVARNLAQQRVEAVVKEIPIPPALLLVLLSEDVHSISRLAQQYDLRLSVQPAHGHLVAEGLQNNISSLVDYLNLQERELVSANMPLNEYDMPPPLILRQASRMAGAYIEPSPISDTLTITASAEDILQKATRTVWRYLNQTVHEGGIPLLAQLPYHEEDAPFPSCAFFPFMAHKATPWSLKDQRFFRIRQVTEWLEEEPTAEYEGLGPLISFEGREFNLVKRLPSLASPVRSEYRRSWTASVGHVVCSSEYPSIAAPLPGKKPLREVTKFVKDANLATHFIPSLPSPLLTSNPASIITVHRALYRKARTPKMPINRLDTKAIPSEVFLLEVAMQHIINAPELDDLDEQDSREESISLHPIGGPTRCRVGTEESVDILMPDRPMDMRLTVRDFLDVNEPAEPEELKAYLDQLLKFLNFTVDQQPSAPESLIYDGVTYVLDTSSSIRRTEEQFSRESSTWGENAFEYATEINIISETSLDLESKEKSSSCILHTTHCHSQDDWNMFMARCTSVTSIPFTASAEPKQQQVPYFSE